LHRRRRGSISHEYTSIAVDARCNSHISYYSVTAKALRYATKVGGTWIRETVDAAYDVGWFTSLALDTQSNPHVSYRDHNNGDLKYATKVGGAWTTEMVDAMGDVGWYTSLALDAEGMPHVSYFDGTNGDLKYATKDGGAWTLETVDATDVVGQHTSLVLDTRGNPHISYYDVTNDALKYAVKLGGAWTMETVDATGDVGWYTSLALDTQGKPNVSYWDVANDDLKYAIKVEGVWTTETVDATGNVGRYTSLALDAEGNPQICYWDASPHYNLKYATKRFNAWEILSIDEGGDVGRFAALALDYQGNRHVSYHDNGNGDLLYSTSAVQLASPVGGEHWSAGGQETVTWDGAGEVDILLSQDGGASYVTLLSSVSGGIAAVNVPGWTTDLARVKIVRNSPYSTSESPALFSIGLEKRYPWWTTKVDTVGDVGAWASLALGPQGNPHISYHRYSDDATYNDLKYAVKTGGSWATETADASGTTGTRTSLALDEEGNPHISYYWSAGHLRYATRVTGGSWVKETVWSGTAGGFHNSLALDAQGNPHIGFYEGVNTALRYVRKDGGSWLPSEYVDTGGAEAAGYYVSIAVDAQGIPHVSYYIPFAGGILRYATKIGGSFAPGNLIGGNVGTYTSIALDAQGNPCISYRDEANGHLEYAAKSGGTWSFETVDTESGSGFYTSLALDANDIPHIGYASSSTDLRYAVKIGDSWSTTIIDSTGDVGAYTSLALDAQGNPRIAYYDESNGDLKYASTAIEVANPSPGTTWPVGAARALTWDGIGVVDVWLSVDGGVAYDLIASNVSGGSYMLTVPHTPSRFCKVKMERRVEANTFGTYYYPHSVAVSDSFFTIETSVSLLAMMVAPAEQGGGNLVTWNTDPGPEDLRGYRLEKQDGRADWLTLVSLTKETSHHDTEGSPGDRYRLFAINGLGEELYLGEASDGNVPSFGGRLTVWPVPFQSGELNVAFPTGGPGGVSALSEVVVYDVAGHRVRTIASGTYPVGERRATWDGRDESGRLVASGIYFIRATSGMTQQTRKLVIVR
jgi:hypothetical protein